MKRYLLIMCVLFVLISTVGFGASAAEIATASIPVTFHQGGSMPEDPEQYTVELTPVDPTFPMPADSEAGVYRMQITAGTSGNIVIPCDRVGVFTYTVRQIPGGNKRCIYDESVYQLAVFVTYGENGAVEANAVATLQGASEKIDIEFANYYSVPDGVTISAIKTLDGRTPADGKFIFQLLNHEGNVLETAENEGKEVVFQTLYFDAEGTFTFTVKEVIGKDSNIVYDKTEYKAVIEVTLNENRDYSAVLTYMKGEKEHIGTPTFANKTVSVTPATGDTVNILLYAVIFVAAAAALVVVLRKKRKKEQ